MTEPQTPSAASYWSAAFAIEDSDLEALYNLLLETEIPLTTEEMAHSLIQRRCAREKEALTQQQEGAVLYMPQERYTVGQRLVFPALLFAHGEVTGLRPGHNPALGGFEVITVVFNGSERVREFAAGLPEHKLNKPVTLAEAEEFESPETIYAQHGATIVAKLEARLQANPELVRLAWRWFPRALLTLVNIGHLNLAEAVLDMAGGGPLPAEALLKEVGLPDNTDPRLQAFSLNYALQEDERFDEVGPAGQILWHLRRLEPAAVQTTPRTLLNATPTYDRSRLTPALLALENEIDDELIPAEASTPAEGAGLVTITFPHFRAGTLPLSARLAPLFPIAHKAPRVRCLFVDGNTGEQFPGWVVRGSGYVYGLEEWYKQTEMVVGGLLKIQRSPTGTEIILKADKRRPTREWVRTATASPDGRLLFSMQRRPIAVAYDELMVVAVDNPAALEEAARKSEKLPFARLTADLFRELAKLNPQSAVHAKTLYAALNVARRCAPGAVFAELVAHPYYAHVGDAYWRFDQSQWTE